MGLDPKVWLPHFQFVMQTMAISYPKHPNDVSKKKYFIDCSQKDDSIAFRVNEINSFLDKPKLAITSYSPAIDALKNGGSSELTVIFTPASNNFLTGCEL